MKDLEGRVAVVTGAGSGIGRGTALALAESGMHVVVADIDEASAKAVAGELGGRSIAVRTDVADRDSVAALADAAYDEFGAVHVLHNNAGVALMMRLDSMKDVDWDWILSINLKGVINGLQAFLPRFKAQDGEKHVVNTASMAGMFAPPMLGAYNATKFAVVAISETLREEVAPDNIGVSVLCPGVVGTNIMQNTLRDRPAGGADMQLPNIDRSGAGTFSNVKTPEEVGRLVRDAIVDNESYIFTHPELAAVARARFDRIMAAFERASQRTNA
jgi:NAD(P)-dependent dehydrogenase (short-subunit alcohol dehydrogenase family)